MSTAVFGAPEWRAQSGRTVRVERDGIHFARGLGFIGHDVLPEAEEFFLAKRDAELGRWRWPENPDYVVIDAGAGFANILHEPTMGTTTWERHWSDVRSTADEAGVAYFEAHPAHSPWHDANHGEVWQLDFIGVSRWVAVEAGDSEEPRPVFRDPHTLVQIEVDDPKITAGVRIYPEDAS